MNKVVGAVVFLASGSLAFAGAIAIPNFSFESPPVPPAIPYAQPGFDYWEETPQPSWYDPSQNGDTPWYDYAGEFYNIPYPGEYIDNVDGVQAAFIQGYPDAGFFQDYDSIYGTNTAPSHAFNATFRPGASYDFTIGINGYGYQGSTPQGATIQISLYYRDAASNVVTIGATTVTNGPAVFTNELHLFDFTAHVATVRAGDAWAGKHIGMWVTTSTNTSDAAAYGGNWDLDNARLTETFPQISGVSMANSQLGVTISGEAGARFEIQSATNLAATPIQWTSVGIVTNVGGSVSFTDTNSAAAQRFYRARQL